MPLSLGAKKRVHARKGHRQPSLAKQLSGSALPLEWLEKGLLAVGLFALPLVIYPGHPDPTVTKMTVALVWVGLLLGLTAVRLLRERGPIHFHQLWLPFAALFAVSGLSLLNSINLQASLLNLALFAGYFALTLLVAHHVRDQQDAFWFVGILLAAGSVAAGYGLLQYYGFFSSNQGSGAAAMTATFGNKNYLGGYLTYLFFPGLGLILLAEARWVKLCLVGVLSLFFAALWGIQQDAAWIVLIIVGILAVVGLMWGRLRQSRAWIAGLVGVFSVILMSMTIFLSGSRPATQEEGVTPDQLFLELSRPFTDRSASVRLFDWRLAVAMLRDHPFVGVGLGAYKLQYLSYKAKALTDEWAAPYADSYIEPAAQAHNDYVQWAAETGLLGALALLVAIGYLVWTALRGFFGDPEPTRRRWRWAVMAGIGAIGAHALVDFPLHLPASALVLVVCLGILFSPYLNEQSRVGTNQRLKSGRVWMRALAVVILALGLLLGSLGVREFQAQALAQEAITAVLEWGDLVTAEKNLERSVARSLAPAYNALLLGAIYFLQGQDADKSVPLFRLAIKGRPSEMSYLMLGQTLLLTGRREEGRQILEELLMMDPRPEVAVEAYRFWELSELSAVSELLAAQRWISLRAYQGAERAMEHLFSEELDRRTQLELWRLQAQLMLQRGEVTEASALLKMALEQDPGAEWASLQLAQLYVKENPSEAQAFLAHTRLVLQEDRARVEAQLSVIPPSAKRQLLRAQLAFLNHSEQEVHQLEGQLQRLP